MHLHTFPWNLPGNSVVLHDINLFLQNSQWTSLLVALLSRDQIMTITHFIMLNSFMTYPAVLMIYISLFIYLIY